MLWLALYLTVALAGLGYGLFIAVRRVVERQTVKMLGQGCPFMDIAHRIDKMEKDLKKQAEQLGNATSRVGMVEGKLQSEERRKAEALKELERSIPLSAGMARDGDL